MIPHKPTPEQLYQAYKDGFQGWIWNKAVEEEWINFCSSYQSIYAVNPALRGLHKERPRALLYLAREKYDPNAFAEEAQTTGDCLDGDTIVLGETHKKIKDIKVGDKVWTGEGNLTTVNFTRTITTNKPLVKIKGTGSLPLICTQDHKILVYTMGKVNNKRVSKQYYEREKNKNGLCKVIEIYESRVAEWKQAKDLTTDDCLLTPLAYEEIPLPTDCPGDLVNSEGGRFFLGCFSGNGCENKNRIDISTPKEALVEILCSILNEHGFNPKVKKYKGKNCFCVSVHNSTLSRWIREQMYDSDRAKSFPGYLLGDESYIDGLVATDGYFSVKSGFNFDSTSKSLIFGMYNSLVKLGFGPTIGECSRSKGTYANSKPLYRVIWKRNRKKFYTWNDDTFLCRPINKIEFIEGTSIVYDIGVEDGHHSFIGNGLVVSNCTSHGDRNARDITRSVEILNGDSEQYYKRGATEPTYGARGHSGQGMDPYRAAKFVTEWGFLFRESYRDSSKGITLDLSKYNANIGINWGRSGVPQDIKELCKQYNVGEFISPKTAEEALDLLAAGKACHSGQSWGTSDSQRSDGINRKSDSWSHDMATGGYDLTREFFKEEVVFVHNSWGRWNEPNPVWLAHEDVYGKWIPGTMAIPLSEWEDYFVNSGSIHFYSDVKGFPISELPYIDIEMY